MPCCEETFDETINMPSILISTQLSFIKTSWRIICLRRLRERWFVAGKSCYLIVSVRVFINALTTNPFASIKQLYSKRIISIGLGPRSHCHVLNTKELEDQDRSCDVAQIQPAYKSFFFLLNSQFGLRQAIHLDVNRFHRLRGKHTLFFVAL